mmetsp:Transcript_10142/g.14887  ORF Transcript_10142/g.14887 Transcript_10142/m.14887 type:complete len:632 (+) Transcript_10142:212-2107(+)
MELPSITHVKKKRDFATMSANENAPRHEPKKHNILKKIGVLFAQEELQALLPSSPRATIINGAQHNSEMNTEEESCNEKKLVGHLNKSTSSLHSSNMRGEGLPQADLKGNQMKDNITPRTNTTNSRMRGENDLDIVQANINVDASVPKRCQPIINGDINSSVNTYKGSYRRCMCCSAPATVWCCECGQCLCTECDNQRHDTVALDSFRRPFCSHRVEHIISGDCGLPILSPMLELVVFFIALEFIRRTLWAHAGSMLTVDYFFESVCPQVGKLRNIVFRLDHALYPLLKGQLGEWCDTEDAFLKIFTDLWVRGILTHTDSFALLMMKVKSMIAALMIVVLVVAPLLAVPYAVVATFVRFIEIIIFPNNWRVVRIFAKLIRGLVLMIWLPCRIFGWCCKSTIFGCILMDNSDYYRGRYPIKIPPKTGHRKRPTPSHGISDLSIWGLISRIARVLRYFYTKAHRAILGAVVTGVFFALVCRILLLSLPRCGSGLLWSNYFYAEEELVDSLSQRNQCFSIDNLARNFLERMGLQIPDLNSLGEEGRILQRMQDSTENDVLDDTLQRIFKGLMRHILEAYPRSSIVIVCTIIFGLAFAGLIRRFMFWFDLQRREKYRTLRFKEDRSRQTRFSPEI